MDNFKNVDEKRVRAFIQWSQDKAIVFLTKEGKTSPSIVEINFTAWHILKKGVRGNSSHAYDNDFDAAAAEHYMYIRFLAGQTGDPACYAAPTLYAAKKVVDQVLGRLQSGQAQGGHPVLPSNPNIVAWGHKGVVDGLNDYKLVSKGAKYNVGGAVEDLAGFSLSKDTATHIGNYAVTVGNGVPAYLK